MDTVRSYWNKKNSNKLDRTLITIYNLLEKLNNPQLKRKIKVIFTKITPNNIILLGRVASSNKTLSYNKFNQLKPTSNIISPIKSTQKIIIPNKTIKNKMFLSK